MANINYQRKGVRISIAVFGSGDAGTVPVLDAIRKRCDPPPEMMSVREDGGEVLSFFAPVEPRKADGVEFMARFFSATDARGDWRIWNSLLRQADGVIFVTGLQAGAAESNFRARALLDTVFPVRAADSPIVFLCTGDCTGDPGVLGEKLGAAGKALFVPGSGNDAVTESAEAALKGAIARFQRQFELMGGQGRVDEKVSLRTSPEDGAEAKAPGHETTGEDPATTAAVGERAEARPWEPPAASTVPAGTADILEKIEDEPAGPVVMSAEPPAGDRGGGGAGMAEKFISGEDITGLTESLRSASAVVSKVPALCEAVAHVAVAVRMISTRVEGLEKVADEMPRAEFSLESAERIGSLLAEAGHTIAALNGEKERLISLLGESDEAREAGTKRYEGAVAEAGAERERLNGEIEALKAELDRLRGALSEAEGGHENLSARLQEEKAAREAEARQHESDIVAARGEHAALEEKAAKAAAETAEAHKEVEVLKVAVESIERQLEAARTEAENAKSHAERHAGEAHEMSNRLGDIDRELKDNTFQLEKTRAEAAELRSALDAAQNTVNSFREQVMAEQARAAGAREAEQRANSDLKASQAEIAALKAERDGALQQAEEARRGAEQALEQLKTVEEETRTIRQAAAKKDAHIRALTEEMTKKEADIASLKGSIGEMAAKFQEAASLATLQGVHVRPSSPPTPYPPASAPRRGPVLPPNIPLPPKRVTQKFGSQQPDPLRQVPAAGQPEEAKKDEEKKP